MLIATTKVVQQTEYATELKATIIGYFNFQDNPQFTNVVIKCDGKQFRFPIQNIPVGDENHRAILFGEKTLEEIQELVPGMIPLQVTEDQFLPANGGSYPTFDF